MDIKSFEGLIYITTTNISKTNIRDYNTQTITD